MLLKCPIYQLIKESFGPYLTDRDDSIVLEYISHIKASSNQGTEEVFKCRECPSLNARGLNLAKCSKRRNCHKSTPISVGNIAPDNFLSPARVHYKVNDPRHHSQNIGQNLNNKTVKHQQNSRIIVSALSTNKLRLALFYIEGCIKLISRTCIPKYHRSIRSFQCSIYGVDTTSSSSSLASSQLWASHRNLTTA